MMQEQGEKVTLDTQTQLEILALAHYGSSLSMCSRISAFFLGKSKGVPPPDADVRHLIDMLRLDSSSEVFDHQYLDRPEGRWAHWRIDLRKPLVNFQKELPIIVNRDNLKRANEVLVSGIQDIVQRFENLQNYEELPSDVLSRCVDFALAADPDVVNRYVRYHAAQVEEKIVPLFVALECRKNPLKAKGEQALDKTRSILGVSDECKDLELLNYAFVGEVMNLIASSHTPKEIIAHFQEKFTAYYKSGLSNALETLQEEACKELAASKEHLYSLGL